MRSVTDTVLISANKRRRSTGLHELWVYRELFYYFAWRDIKVRYKQTVLGVGWAILQPMITAAIFTVFFNRVAKIDTGSLSVPYPVFVYLGLTLWGAFSSATTGVSNSILSNSGVVNKIYFPRIILPLASTALSVVDFFFAIIVFFLLLIIFGVSVSLLGYILLIPMLLLIIFAALGMGLLFAALNVKYRDVRSALPFIIQAMFFMTPVIYPVTMIPERFQMLVYLNPAAGPISTIKAAFFNQPIPWNGLALSFAVSLILFMIGYVAFKRAERHFPDYL
jgi:lipopolysaccharide transport system permease protein